MTLRGVVMRGYSDERDELVQRLRRIEGQIRGLQRNVESDEYCIDILTQVAAASKALQSVAIRLLDQHLRHCVTEAAAADREGSRPKWTRPLAPSNASCGAEKDCGSRTRAECLLSGHLHEERGDSRQRDRRSHHAQARRRRDEVDAPGSGASRARASPLSHAVNVVTQRLARQYVAN